VRTVPDAALVWRDGCILWSGPRTLLPPEHLHADTVSAGGGLVVPGLIDCHTHLAFAGWRADEFEERILGRSYLDIARAGGGIQRTVAQTRAASEDALFERCASHLREMAALGVTTVECKSGYGLDVEHEVKLLTVYQRLSATQSLRIIPTLLAAHAVAPEFGGRRNAYLRLVTRDIIPRVVHAGLARFCDVFVEEAAFSLEEARRVLAAASALGLRAKLHADQLSDGGGARLAAEVHAVSADHLEQISADGIACLAAAHVVAVSLPFAALYLGARPMPARALLAAGVPVAVATDFNPGTAPSFHLPLAMTLACTLQRMTPAEAFCGATLVAAAALDRHDELGALDPGYAADFAVIDAPDVETWLYHFRANACRQTWVGGQRVH
jgi:imidazolonepropionase